ncbi:MAG: GAF domain-containing protein [Edaphocola sp.]
MAETYNRIDGNKAEQYQHLYEQIELLLTHETNTIANLANITALLKEQFGWLWIGFYLVDELAGNLVLGPFQGPLACTRIAYGKGVCGTAWALGETQVVADVATFPGHIACSGLSQSEIVVPIKNNGKVVAVLDIDSEHLASFDEQDKRWLEKVADLIKW